MPAGMLDKPTERFAGEVGSMRCMELPALRSCKAPPISSVVPFQPTQMSCSACLLFELAWVLMKRVRGHENGTIRIAHRGDRTS